MYDCLPLYHSVGGVVATGARAGRRRLGGDRARNSPPARSGTTSCAGTARCSSISASSAATCSRRRPRPPTRAHRLRLACGNGLRADVWEPFQERFAHPAHPGILRRDRGQFLALQRRGQARRHRPHPRPSWRAASPPPSCATTRRAGCRRATTTGFCIRCAPRRGGRGHRPDRRRRGGARRPLRGLYDRGRHRAQGAARRVRAGRRLVPHRRPHAARRAGLLHLRRPHRRHVPLEGRERRDHRGRRGASRPARASSRPSSMASRSRAPTARPAWRRWWSDETLRSRRPAPASGRAPAGLCAAGVPAPLRRRSR